MTISYLQTSLEWENIDKNIQKIGEYVEGKLENTDLLVLPEMFTTGFTMNNTPVAEVMSGKGVSFMKNLAQSSETVIAGSLIIKEANEIYNRFVFAFPSGEIDFYDKRHLFRPGNEHLHYKSGFERKIIAVKGFRICPLVCYDLRFPVWSRNRNDYDLLIYVANWPGSRREVWQTLLKARAIENQSFVLGVNRIGTDGTGLSYSGDSMLIDAKGQVISSIPMNVTGLKSVQVSIAELNEFREKFPVANDADSFDFYV